jgi:hypothetical protein
MVTERNRIEFLLERDGLEATRAWVLRTLKIYQDALAKPRHHAALLHYRPLYEQAVHTYEQWLADHAHDEQMPARGATTTRH